MLCIMAVAVLLKLLVLLLELPFGVAAGVALTLRIPLAGHLNMRERVALEALLALRVQGHNPLVAVVALTQEHLALVALVKSSSLFSRHKERT